MAVGRGCVVEVGDPVAEGGLDSEAAPLGGRRPGARYLRWEVAAVFLHNVESDPPMADMVSQILAEPPWVGWRLSCAPGIARSACLVAGDGVGVAAFVLDRAKHPER
jgi:hypothetical protein